RCIGVVAAAWITPERTGHAIIRFSRTPLGELSWNEVGDGTLLRISIGLRKLGYRAGEYDDNGRKQLRLVIAWEPLEISFVAIPADSSCRVLEWDLAAVAPRT